MDNNFDINYYLKQIDKTLKEDLESIPDVVLKAILDRALIDARELLNSGEQNNTKKVTYTIYRSYVLGMQLEKILNKRGIN